jgi:hypothetical protein
MKIVPRVLPVLLFGGIAVVVGCGTIMHGTSQDIGLASSPSGAKVTLDNKELGVTPVIAKLSRKDNHVVHFALDGYQPADLTLTRSVSGWVWGNIAFGGLVGLAVDAISGGLYKLSPEQLTATMAKATASTTKNGGLYVAVVMRPDSAWQKIGTLARLDQPEK